MIATSTGLTVVTDGRTLAIFKPGQAPYRIVIGVPQGFVCREGVVKINSDELVTVHGDTIGHTDSLLDALHWLESEPLRPPEALN